MGVKQKIKQSKVAEGYIITEVFEEFIAEKEALNKAASTIRNYRQSFEYFMQFNNFDDETTTDVVKQSMFYHWIGTMRQEGVKATSINHYLRDCRAFFYWCMDVDRKYIEPAFKINMVEAQEETIKLYSEEDMETLLEKPRRNDNFATWRTWAVVNWVLATGNRGATVCCVKLGDINFKKKEIVLAHTKNKKAQIIPLSSSLETVLKEFIRMWRSDADNDSFLFCNIGDEPLTTNALRHSFAKYCKDRGIEQTNLHGLRHSFAKGWIQNNGSTFALQKVLGHSGLDMTRRYVKLFNEDIKEDYDKFSPLDNMKRKANRTQKVKKSEY